MLFSSSTLWIPHTAINAALTGLGAGILEGFSTAVYVQPLGREIPLYVVGAGLGAVSSIISSYIHNFVKGEIHIKEKAQDEASLVLSAMTSSLIFTGSMYLLHTNLPRDFGLINGTVLAAGSSIASDFIINMVY